MILFDFICEAGHVTEHLVSPDTREVKCPECNAISKRTISPVNFKLDNSFPGYNNSWAKKHEKSSK